MGRSGPGYISPTVQREAIQRWADYRHVEIVAWHVDEDESGGTQKRPGLRTAMERIQAKETDGLACWRLNRFARNVKDAIADVETIHAAGAHLACVQEDIDPTGPFGRFILTILLAVATLERDNAVAGFEEAKRRAVARGAYVSRTPWGYERNEDGTLSPHPERSRIVAEAFRITAADSLNAALTYLRQVAPERRWNATKVRRLISQRSYLGETRNGDLVQVDTHEPIVSRAIWEAAQTTPKARAPSGDFPLSGLLRCGTCGAAMTGGRGGRRALRTYRCSTGSTRTPCERGANVTASIAEEYVQAQARSLLEGFWARVSDPEADTLALLERTIIEAEAELDAFAADLTMRRALADRYHAHLTSRVEAVEKARDAYREQARQAQTALTIQADQVVDDWQLLSVALRHMFDAIIVRPGRGIRIEDRLTFVPAGVDGLSGESEPERSQ